MRILHAPLNPMKKAQAQTQKPVVPKKRPLNLTVDSVLADTFSAYCQKNRKAGSISREVEEMMIQTIKTRGHRYGLNLPAHLAA